MPSRTTRRCAAGISLLLVCVLSACGSGSAGPSASDPPTASPAPAMGPPPAPGATDWTTYHHDMARSGAVDGTVKGLSLKANLALDGAVYASPVVVPTAAGQTVVVATEGNSLYGLRGGQDAKLAWQVNVGPPVPRSELPCGNIDPLGMTGTPVYDAASGLVYVTAELDKPIRHELVAVDPGRGVVAWRTPIDPPGAVPSAEQQRGALALSGGKVWVPLGGLAGDCGPYIGKVVGVPTGAAEPPASSHAVYAVPTAREAGIWTPPGPAVDADGTLLVTSGNGASTSEPYDGSDSVMRIDASGKLVDRFTPTGWQNDNAEDLDLGSMGPLPVGDRIVQAGKRGVVYLLDAAHLGGIGGQLASVSGCTAFGGGAVFSGGSDPLAVLPCTEGVTAFRVSGSTLSSVWKTAQPGVDGSPVVIGSTVVALDTKQGLLVALDATTGAVGPKLDVGPVNRFATPAVSGSTLYLGTMKGLAIVDLG